METKAALYIEHAWPELWVMHAEREELEIIGPGTGNVM